VATPTPEELIAQAEQSQAGREGLVSEYYDLNPQETPPGGTGSTIPADGGGRVPQDWRSLPTEFTDLPFWQRGLETSQRYSANPPAYQWGNDPRYSTQLFKPSAQLWNQYTPTEKYAYQSGVTSTGASWDDWTELLNKNWGKLPTGSNRASWTPAGYKR